MRAPNRLRALARACLYSFNEVSRGPHISWSELRSHGPRSQSQCNVEARRALAVMLRDRGLSFEEIGIAINRSKTAAYEIHKTAMRHVEEACAAVRRVG